MNDQIKLLDVVEQLHQEVQRLEMALTVQQGGYAALVHHLAAQGFVRPLVLAQSLQTLGQSQDDEDWQAGHESLAGVVRLVAGLPSLRGPKNKPLEV